MLSRRKISPYVRASMAKELLLGLPAGISVDGAMAMEALAGQLCDIRVVTLDQAVRLIGKEKKTTVRYWLEHYPYIKMQKVQAHYYDGSRQEWIRALTLGMYTLTFEARAAFDVAGRYTDDQGVAHRRIIAEPPTAKSKSLDAMIQASELYSRLAEVDEADIRWVSNIEMQQRLQDEGILTGHETLNTVGCLNVLPTSQGNAESLWGMSIQTKDMNNIVTMSQKIFPSSRSNLIQGITLAKHEDMTKALQTIVQRTTTAEVGHVRFMPYEFTWHHPEWFKAVLEGNRWAVLNSLLEYHHSVGHEVVDRMERYGAGYGRDNPYRYQVTMPDGNGGKVLEYIDTTYGATAGSVRWQLESRQPQVSPRTGEYPERYVLYVGSAGEYEGLTRAAETLHANVELRLIDWPS